MSGGGAMCELGKPKVKTIPLEEMRRLMKDDCPALMVDVRTPAEFRRVHAVGAHLMPLDELDAATVNRHRAADGRVYVICQAGGRSAMACEQLMRAGVGDVYSVEGGTAAWEKAGLPVVRGRGVISLERQVRIAAGSLVLLGSLLAWFVRPGFVLLPGLVGSGLIFAGVTDFCGMGILLGKMPWNK